MDIPSNVGGICLASHNLHNQVVILPIWESWLAMALQHHGVVNCARLDIDRGSGRCITHVATNLVVPGDKQPGSARPIAVSLLDRVLIAPVCGVGLDPHKDGRITLIDHR
jgi:hypothetical protein